MAGSSASGKSYVISKISSGQIEPRIVNTDTWTEFFKAYSSESWAKNMDKVRHLTKKQLVLFLNSMLPLWIDGTSSNPSSLMRRNGILKSIGYDTSMIWVDINLDTALKRSEERERPVPPETIREIYKKIEKLKPYYTKDFDNFMVIDNNEGELTDKAILKAFKKMKRFFDAPIENPIGKQLVKEMVAKGWKYLLDGKYDIGYLKRLVGTWYIS